MFLYKQERQIMNKEKTIDTYSMFGKEIKNTKQQWINRWSDCTVSSLAGLMPINEYKSLKERIINLAGEDFERRYENESK